MTSEIAVAFLDTNYFLHYRSFDQVDWPALLQADSVTIVIAPIVLNELDEKKYSHPNARIRDRAKQSVSLLGKLLRNARVSEPTVRENTTLAPLPKDPDINFEEYGLQRGTQDDHLLAAMIHFRSNDEMQRLVLVTGDTGISLKAEIQGFEVLEIPDELMLPAEQDSDKKKIVELQKSIAELQGRIPCLSILFGDLSQLLTVQAHTPRPVDTAYINQQLAELREKHPNLNPSSPSNRRRSPIETLLMPDLNVYSPEDVADYNQRLDTYFSDYRRFMRLAAEYQNVEGLTIFVPLTVQNEGTCVATDIDINIHVPDGVIVRTKEEFENLRPVAPELPQMPHRLSEKFQHSLIGSYRNPFDHISDITFPTSSPAANHTPLRIKKTNSFDIHCHVTKLKHNRVEKLGELVLTFDRYETAKSFSMDYTITASEIPQPVNGKLNIIVEQIHMEN